MSKVHVDLGLRSYDIVIEPGLASGAGNHLKQVLYGKKVAVVSDSNVDNFHGATLLPVLQAAGFEPVLIILEPGETTKKMESVTRLCREFVQGGLDRNSAVIAFGGGVVGDVAGFAAAVFLRGIHYVQIPSTLLADCDSSVGGKVGINLDNAKNLVGSFYQPKIVLIDPELLTTLPRSELSAGLVEVIKTGLIGDPQLYRLIFSKLDDILDIRDMELMCEIIERSVTVKANIVSRDEKESGLRRNLNFGHTIGHAIEGVSEGKNILHGEAVLYGMRAALLISKMKGLLSESDYKTIMTDLSNIECPADIRTISFEDMFDFIKKDKKKIDERLSFILLQSIGNPCESKDVTESELKKAFSFIQEQ